MKIIVDAMGGDNAPAAVVKGAVMAVADFGVDVVLVGREAEVRACLQNEGAAENAHISVVNATEVVTMEDEPATAVRHKKDSSMTVALELLKAGEGEACVSAGSTGALLTGATLLVKRIRGIRRAALAPVFPNGGHGVMLIDCGANVECTPEYLLQFAYMGSFYAERIMGCEKPRVALLNIGTEDTKGTELQKAALAHLRAAAAEGRLNFVGNMEASDLLKGKVDVLVSDGFSGNILLKATEGAAYFMLRQLKGAFYRTRRNKLAALIMHKELGALKKLLDPSEVGGTAMMGISRPVIKAHGSSDARAVRSAIGQAVKYTQAGIIDMIASNIDYMKISD